MKKSNSKTPVIVHLLRLGCLSVLSKCPLIQKPFLLALLVGIWLGVLKVSYGQNVEEMIYKAYLSPKYDVAIWKEAIKIREAALGKDPKNSKYRYELALAQFALLSATMRTRDEKVFDEYYDAFLKNIDLISESDKKWAEPYALKAAAYGLKMGYSPMQGMFLGGKSSALIDKAKKLDPNSALAWKTYANSKLHTPETFGGDINEAIFAYEKAVSLFESKPEELKMNWLYLDTMAFLGQAYLRKGESSKAIAIYEKALKAEPEFGWVKHVLMPKAKSAK